MRQPQFKKFQHEHLADIITEVEPMPGVYEFDFTKDNEVDLLNRFVENKDFSSALKFLSLGLPAREAIWLSYLSVEPTLADNSDAASHQALKLIHSWVHEPSEQKRQAAKVIADRDQLYTAHSWANMAIFWSGGSIAPVNQPEVEPSEWMCGHAVANAILLAVQQSQDQAAQSQLCIKRGIHIAMGGNGIIKSMS